MRTVLCINDCICSSLKQLCDIISEDLTPNTPIYEDLLTLQRDGELAQWLAEGSAEEIELSKKLNDLPIHIPNSELVNRMRKIFVGTIQEVQKPHFSSFIELQQIRCVSNGEIVRLEELTQHRFQCIISGMSQKCDAKFLIDFKVTKIDNESFDINLLGNYKLSLINKNVGQIVTIETNSFPLENGATYSLLVDNANLAEIVVSFSELFIKVNNVEFEMVRVEGDKFMMGASSQNSDADDDERPAHEVTLNTFYIGKYEVTQELWQAVMGNNPSPDYFKGEKLPVVYVDWEKDCKDFIRELNRLTNMNFRLPTEAEWEYAARGGKKSNGFEYAGSNNIDTVAWYDGNSGGFLHPVGQNQPNELGLYDMSGNIFEWCQDLNGNYSSKAQTNPTGPSSGYYRIIRGGCWISGMGGCRSSFRAHSEPTRRDQITGLRLVL
jgi:formylglycine-generating enzyme required for sulfatase activity